MSSAWRDAKCLRPSLRWAGQVRGPAEPLPYRRYRTSGGTEVRVGRGAKGNDEHRQPEQLAAAGMGGVMQHHRNQAPPDDEHEADEQQRLVAYRGDDEERTEAEASDDEEASEEESEEASDEEGAEGEEEDDDADGQHGEKDHHREEAREADLVQVHAGGVEVTLGHGGQHRDRQDLSPVAQPVDRRADHGRPSGGVDGQVGDPEAGDEGAGKVMELSSAILRRRSFQVNAHRRAAS